MRTFRSPLSVAVAALLGLSILLSTAPAQAQTQSLTVMATVDPTCEMDAIPAADFGNIAPGVDLTTTTDITWRCSDGTDADITIDDGASGVREMTDGGGNVIPYELYQDPGPPAGDRWGTAATETVSVTGTGMGNDATETVHASVVGTTYENVPPGAYSHVVTVTITVM